ncbi:hypothetical protein CPA50_12220 [Marinobacter sp. ANT_B65]|nr:hypothetical protein CPA50_12220 [Marinobacter sp. ANT_B65]
MRRSYENRYFDAVQQFIKGGMEVRLLSGRTVRQCQNSDYMFEMTAEFEQRIRKLCSGSLAVSTDSAELLTKCHRERGIRRSGCATKVQPCTPLAEKDR